MTALRLLALSLLLVSVDAAAEYESRLRDAGSLGAIRLAESEDPAARKVYIVQLREPAAAAFQAAQLKVAHKTAGVPRARFDKASPAVQGYTAKLAEQQNRVLAKAGPDAQLIYRYQFSLNGFAARMHPAQAHKLQALPEVINVWE